MIQPEPVSKTRFEYPITVQVEDRLRFLVCAPNFAPKHRVKERRKEIGSAHSVSSLLLLQQRLTFCRFSFSRSVSLHFVVLVVVTYEFNVNCYKFGR